MKVKYLGSLFAASILSLGLVTSCATPEAGLSLGLVTSCATPEAGETEADPDAGVVEPTPGAEPVDPAAEPAPDAGQ